MNDSKKVLLSGASGLIGRALASSLRQAGHEVSTLSRTRGDFIWDLRSRRLDAAALDGVDCVVHLAGETIAQRWTQSSRARILSSRVASTRLLADAILETGRPIDFICASGVNYYGHRCGNGQTEESPAGEGFLAAVCQDWEAAHRLLSDAGQRALSVRIGVVLDPKGGALKRLLPIFRCGLGGPAGSGRQLMSWIGLSDLVRIFSFLITNREINGPVNAVSPTPVTNAEFASALGRVLGRPACLPAPGAMFRLIFGAMADETILSDIGAMPSVLNAAGFAWEDPEIESVIRKNLFK